MIYLVREEIEKKHTLKPILNKERWILFWNESSAKPSKSRIDFNFQGNRGWKLRHF